MSKDARCLQYSGMEQPARHRNEKSDARRGEDEHHGMIIKNDRQMQEAQVRANLTHVASVVTLLGVLRDKPYRRISAGFLVRQG